MSAPLASAEARSGAGPLVRFKERLKDLVHAALAPLVRLFAATGLVSAASIAIVLALDHLNDKLSHWRG